MSKCLVNPASVLNLCVALAAILVNAPTAWAQADSLPEISGFDLLNPPGADGTVQLVALTRTGQPIPADRISFKSKDDVVRVTYRDVTLAKGLGPVVPIGTRDVRRVKKAYAVRDGEAGVFVRVKFNAAANRAMVGHATTFERGTTVITFPFGTEIATGPGAGSAPAVAPDGPAPPSGSAEVAEAVQALPIADKAAPVAAPPREGIHPTGMFEWADVPQPNPTDTEVAPEAKEPKPSATPLELADETRGPSITKVVVALFVIGVLIAVLALATKKLRNIRGGASLVHGEGVKVLAKYPVAKGNMVLVLEVLDEVLVVSQNPSGDLALLHHMPQERAEQLRQSEVFAPDGVSTGFFDGLLKRRKSERARRATHSFVRDYSDDVDDYAGTLDDLAQSLESNARAGALRETPPSLAKITPLFGESHNDFAAHDSKAEPIDFQELLARRAAHKRYGSGASPLPTGGSRDEKDTVSLQTGTGRMDISDVTQQVRERIRSLGRL